METNNQTIWNGNEYIENWNYIWTSNSDTSKKKKEFVYTALFAIYGDILQHAYWCLLKATYSGLLSPRLLLQNQARFSGQPKADIIDKMAKGRVYLPLIPKSSHNELDYGKKKTGKDWFLP